MLHVRFPDLLQSELLDQFRDVAETSQQIANNTYYYFQDPECAEDTAGVAAGLSTAALPDSGCA